MAISLYHEMLRPDGRGQKGRVILSAATAQIYHCYPRGDGFAFLGATYTTGLP